MIKMIYCVDEENGIGRENTIPWYSSEDFKHFKQETENKKVMMGFNTWRSLPRKPLPTRMNIVVCSDLDKTGDMYNQDSLHTDVIFVNEEAAGYILQNNKEVVIMGGAYLYKRLLPYTDMVIRSTIKGTHECDVFLDLDLDDFEIIKTKTLSDGVIVDYMERKGI